MHIKKALFFKISIFIGCFSFCCSIVSGQSYGPDFRKSLKGLSGVFIKVASVEEAEQLGLRANQLRVNAELILRKNGIAVLESKPSYDRNDPVLGIGLNVICAGDLCAYNLSTNLHQGIFLTRDPKLLIDHTATTWEIGYTGLINKSQIKTVEDEMQKQTETFANDYLAANGA